MANRPNDSIDESPERNVDEEEVSVTRTVSSDILPSAPQKQALKSHSTKTLNRVMIFEKEN